MRVVANIPHSHFTITVFSWNSKFIVKIELGQYEQVFKINETDVGGLEDVKNMLNEPFLLNCMKRFREMAEDFSTAFKNVTA